ncbi:MAG: ATP-binding protein, partial [Phycicoccus sp.]|nr:ATP-binding protein [Phycicoccus sp.]
DPHRLAEAVANLLDNGLRHTPSGGSVHVVVATDPRSAVLEVVDTGAGFHPADAERLFERFYRADTSRTRSSAGSGIGLTLARAIVQAHGGTLTAASDGFQAGARFRIRLLAHPHVRARLIRVIPARARTGHSLRVVRGGPSVSSSNLQGSGVQRTCARS